MSDQPPSLPETRSTFACPQCHTPVSTGDITCPNFGIRLTLADDEKMDWVLFQLLVKRVVEGHASKIEVKSEPGWGNVFAWDLSIASPRTTA